MVTAREPAPDPSPAEAAEIARFGMFTREERMARLADDTNRAVTAIIRGAWGGDRGKC